MVKRLMAVMLMAMLIVVVASAGGVAEADGPPTPVPADTPEDDLAHARQLANENGSYGGGTDGNSGALMFMAGGASGMSGNITPNPWGCRVKAHNPHESHRNPGPGHTQAKATITCTVAPPQHIVTITQDLSRVTGSSIAIEEVKNSSCPSLRGEPECHPTLRKGTLMMAFINTDCEIGTTHRWVQLADARMYVNGNLYSGLAAKAANVACVGPR